MTIKVIKRAFFGFLLGMTIGNVIALISATMSGDGSQIVTDVLIERSTSEATALLTQTLLSGLIGFVSFLGISFYEIESWSMFRIMFAHLFMIIAVFIPVAYYLGWCVGIIQVLIMVLIMTSSYLIVWAIMCAIYRAQVRELNNQQEKFLERNAENNEYNDH